MPVRVRSLTKKKPVYYSLFDAPSMRTLHIVQRTPEMRASAVRESRVAVAPGPEHSPVRHVRASEDELRRPPVSRDRPRGEGTAMAVRPLIAKYNYDTRSTAAPLIWSCLSSVSAWVAASRLKNAVWVRMGTSPAILRKSSASARVFAVTLLISRS